MSRPRAICAEGVCEGLRAAWVSAVLTTGPGGTNAVTGVAGAWLDSTPTLYISGQVKRPDRMFDATGKPLGMRQLGVQEVDICSIVAPITKYAVTILEPMDIRYHLEKAVYLAMHGRPGPVWIDIPLDVQASPIDETALRGFDPVEFANDAKIHGTSNVTEEVTRAIEAFNACERPLLFAGNGIRLARAEGEFEELRKLLGVPTVATWCAADLVPSDDPTYVGRPGTVAARGSNFALQNCDFLLSLRRAPGHGHHRLCAAQPRARGTQGRRGYRRRGARQAAPLHAAAGLRGREGVPDGASEAQG